MRFQNITGKPQRIIFDSKVYNTPASDEPFALSDSNPELLRSVLADDRFVAVDDVSAFLAGEKQAAEVGSSEIEETPKNVLFRNTSDNDVILTFDGKRYVVPKGDKPYAVSGGNTGLVAEAMEHVALILLSDEEKVVAAKKVIVRNRKQKAKEDAENQNQIAPPLPPLPKRNLTPEQIEAEKAEIRASVAGNPGGQTLPDRLPDEKEVSTELEKELEKGISEEEK